VHMAISLRERRRGDGGCAGGAECLIGFPGDVVANLDRCDGAEAPRQGH
jgi:hypothetical protein